MKVKLKPFMVPKFAVLDLRGTGHGDAQSASIPIAELDSDTLDTLADQWLDALYASAKKGNPFCITRAA